MMVIPRPANMTGFYWRARCIASVNTYAYINMQSTQDAVPTRRGFSV